MEYDSILWAHTTFVPSQDGMKVIADSLGSVDGKIVRIVSPSDVDRLVNRQEIPQELNGMFQREGKKLLLICMVGGTSLKAAKVLSEKGFDAESLAGGISSISKESGKPIMTLVKPVVATQH